MDLCTPQFPHVSLLSVSHTLYIHSTAVQPSHWVNTTNIIMDKWTPVNARLDPTPTLAHNNLTTIIRSDSHTLTYPPSSVRFYLRVESHNTTKSGHGITAHYNYNNIIHHELISLKIILYTTMHEKKKINSIYNTEQKSTWSYLYTTSLTRNVIRDGQPSYYHPWITYSIYTLVQKENIYTCEVLMHLIITNNQSI